MNDSQQATWKRVRPVLLTTLVPVAAALVGAIDGYMATEIAQRQ